MSIRWPKEQYHLLPSPCSLLICSLLGETIYFSPFFFILIESKNEKMLFLNNINVHLNLVVADLPVVRNIWTALKSARWYRVWKS